MVKGPNTHQFLTEKIAASSETAEKPAAFTLSGEDALKQPRAARSCKICICKAPTLEKPTCTMPDFVTPQCPMARSTTMTASDWSINKHCLLILHSKHLKHFMLLGNV